jgi:hypothetical protein
MIIIIWNNYYYFIFQNKFTQIFLFDLTNQKVHCLTNSKRPLVKLAMFKLTPPK